MQHYIFMGGYQVMGNMIVVQGQRWTIPLQFGGMAAPPMPYVERIIIQSSAPAQLALLAQQEGLQLSCQRMGERADTIPSSARAAFFFGTCRQPDKCPNNLLAA